MSLNKVFIFWGVSFLFWVFITNILFNIKLSFIIFLLIFAILINTFLYIKKHHTFIVIIMIWLWMWFFYSQINIYKIQQNYSKIEYLYGKKHYIESVVIDNYRHTENFNSYILKTKTINQEIYEFNFILRVPKNFNLNIWDIILLEEKIEKVSNFDNFNYERFLLTKDIYFIIYSNNFHNKWSETKNKAKIYFTNLREKLISNIKSMYPQNEAILLSGILLWERNNIPEYLINSYNNSGLTHFISISWFHISIIIIFLWLMLSFLPIWIRSILIAAFVICFIFLVWFKVPAIRAAIMWIIWYFIIAFWREKDAFSILLLALIAMVLYNPLFLNYDVSFHLSFLAVVWILYTKNFFDKIFFFLPSFFSIKQSFVLTMSAMAWVLPIVFTNFWQINLLTPVANMLVWWIMPFTMLFWFLSIIINNISTNFGYYFWYIPYYLLYFINQVALYFWNLDYFIIKYDFWEHKVFVQIIYLLILAFIIMFLNLRKTKE